jgi:hypothetical protein
MAVNRRTAIFAGGAAVLLLAGAVGVVRAALKCTPGVDCGFVSGYDSPQTVVVLDVDGQTLRAGWQGCAEHADLQAVERRDEVVLRVYWRSRRTYRCGELVDDFAAPSLNLQVQLSAPLGGRRLVGPDGVALPWLDESAMLRFTPPVQMSGLAGLRYRGPAYWYRYPQPAQPAELFPDRLFRTARCLDTKTNGVPVQLLLDQCAYGGAGPAPTASAYPGVHSAGPLVTVRGRPAHVVDYTPDATSSAEYEDHPWRALWWTEGHEIAVLISQRADASLPPLLTASQLIAVADDLWCVRRAACQSPVRLTATHRPSVSPGAPRIRAIPA